MELEFRNKQGNHIFTIRGLMAEITFTFLFKDTNIKMKHEKLNGKIYSTLSLIDGSEPVYGQNEFFLFVVNPGDYVKVIRP